MLGSETGLVGRFVTAQCEYRVGDERDIATFFGTPHVLNITSLRDSTPFPLSRRIPIVPIAFPMPVPIVPFSY